MVKGYLAGTRKEHHRAAREDLPSTKPTKPSAQKTTCSNSGSNSGKSSKRTAATDADIEAAASKRQRLTHSTTKSAGKQCTTTCDPVDVELENDDSDLEEEPVPSTRRALQTKTQSRAPILVLESPVRSGYWVPCSSNRDRDRLAMPRKPRKTGPDWCKPVTGRLAWLLIGYKTGL